MLVAIIINLVYSWYYHANYRIKGSGPVLITNLKHGELAGITLIFTLHACARGKAIGLSICHCHHRRRRHENRQIASSRRLCVL